MASGVATLPSGRLSGGTAMTSSPLIRSGRRLVSRNLTFGQRGSQTHHQVADGGEEVLAVVEHQQRGAVGDVVGERLQLPRPVGGMQAHRFGDGCAQQVGLGRSANGTTQHPSG